MKILELKLIKTYLHISSPEYPLTAPRGTNSSESVNKQILDICNAHFNMTWWSNARIELEFGVLVFVEEGIRSTRRKTLGAGTGTKNKLNPHVTPGPGIEPGPQWWEASALTTSFPHPVSTSDTSHCLRTATQSIFDLCITTGNSTGGLHCRSTNIIVVT